MPTPPGARRWGRGDSPQKSKNRRAAQVPRQWGVHPKRKAEAKVPPSGLQANRKSGGKCIPWVERMQIFSEIFIITAIKEKNTHLDLAAQKRNVPREELQQVETTSNINSVLINQQHSSGTYKRHQSFFFAQPGDFMHPYPQKKHNAQKAAGARTFCPGQATSVVRGNATDKQHMRYAHLHIHYSSVPANTQSYPSPHVQ